MDKKFLVFEKKKSDEYLVMSKRGKEVLGQIYYYKKWDRWVFESTPDSFFSIECLEQISEFIRGLG